MVLLYVKPNHLLPIPVLILYLPFFPSSCTLDSFEIVIISISQALLIPPSETSMVVFYSFVLCSFDQTFSDVFPSDNFSLQAVVISTINVHRTYKFIFILLNIYFDFMLSFFLKL